MIHLHDHAAIDWPVFAEPGLGHRSAPANAGRPETGPHPRGVVLVIVLLALILIAALVFYVFNIGRNVQSRVVTQNAADSAAMGGAGWVARAMNTTAMNNVEMARLIAEINVLDATDQALHPAYHEADTHYRALQDLSPEPGANLSAREANLLSKEMAPYIKDYHRLVRLLGPLKRTFAAPAQPEAYQSPTGSFDVRDYTFYHPPDAGQTEARHGRLWQAMEALDVYSHTILKKLPSLAQRAAADSGQANLHRAGSESEPGDREDRDQAGQAMLVPLAPTLPITRGQFDDFQRPVEHGLLDTQVDDPHYRRGPFDTVFGWRRPIYKTDILNPGKKVIDKPRSEGTGPPGPGGLEPPDIPPTYKWDPPRDTRSSIVAYRVYGPQRWLVRDNRPRLRRKPGSVRGSFLALRNRFAAWKRQYLWHNRSITNFRFPVYLIDWARATSAADGGDRTIVRTRFFVLRIESSIAPGRPGYLLPGTFQEVGSPSITTLEGDWQKPSQNCAPLGGEFGNDPRQWTTLLDRMRNQCQRYQNLSGSARDYWESARFENLQNSDWRKVRFTSKIDRDGQTLWQATYYFCIGVDVGKPLPVRNPHNFDDRTELPAPMKLDYAALDWDDQEARRKYLTFLGIAQQPNSGALWAEGFDDEQAYPNHLALAQARVFNNHSWDLWTQMWHAQLEPIDKYGQWVDRLDASSAADRLPGMSPEALDRLREHMTNIEPAAEFMLRH